MQTTAGDMLRKLGSGIRPVPGAIGGAAGLGAATGKTPLDSQSFAQLLQSVVNGDGPGAATSHGSEPVKLARGSKIELDPEQLRRMGPAVDQAEIGGASKLLAFIDGRGVIVDVASRTVEGIAPSDGSAVPGIDAVVMVPDAPKAACAPEEAQSASPAPMKLPLPGAESIRNASVSDLLARISSPAA